MESSPLITQASFGNDPSKLTGATSLSQRLQGMMSIFVRPEYVPPPLAALIGNAAEIRKLSWNGVPPDLRPAAWQILLVNNLIYACDGDTIP